MPGKEREASPGDFELLGLPYGTPPDEVKKAYKAFVKAWHPDRFPQGSRQQKRAEDRLKDVNAAYRRIRNDWKVESPERRPKGANPAPQSKKEKPRATVASRNRPPSPPLFQLWSQIYARVVASLPSFGSPRTWLCLLLLVPLLILLMDLESTSPPVYRGEPPQSRKPASFLPPGPTPMPQESLQGTALPEQTRQLEGSPAPPPGDHPRTPASAPPRQERSFFSLGSTKAEVQRVQGKPDKVLGQTWVYSLSDVTFRDGRVWRYHNFDGGLKIQIEPSSAGAAGHYAGSFTLGATRDEVLRVQGTPTHVEGNKWAYGFSEVYFREGLVVGFNNFFNNLRVVMQPPHGFNTAFEKDFFTIGSSQDEVLALQGTPTVVQGNLWSYELSDVLFVDGRVRSVNDFSGILKYSQPGSLAEQ